MSVNNELVSSTRISEGFFFRSPSPLPPPPSTRVLIGELARCDLECNDIDVEMRFFNKMVPVYFAIRFDTLIDKVNVTNALFVLHRYW